MRVGRNERFPLQFSRRFSPRLMCRNRGSNCVNVFVGQAWVGEEQLQGLLEPKPAPRTSIAYQAFDVFLLLLSTSFVYHAIVELDLSLWLGDGGY